MKNNINTQQIMSDFFENYADAALSLSGNIYNLINTISNFVSTYDKQNWNADCAQLKSDFSAFKNTAFIPKQNQPPLLFIPLEVLNVLENLKKLIWAIPELPNIYAIEYAAILTQFSQLIPSWLAYTNQLILQNPQDRRPLFVTLFQEAQFKLASRSATAAESLFRSNNSRFLLTVEQVLLALNQHQQHELYPDIKNAALCLIKNLLTLFLRQHKAPIDKHPLDRSSLEKHDSLATFVKSDEGKNILDSLDNFFEKITHKKESTQYNEQQQMKLFGGAPRSRRHRVTCQSTTTASIPTQSLS